MPLIKKKWASKAGLLSSSAQFNDIYGLDPESLSMVPRPVKAVILVFPYNEWRSKREVEDAKDGGLKVHESVFWMKQTIEGACGTMALIHGMANSDVTLAPNSLFQQFIDECREKSPLERGRFLETTSPLRYIHSSVAVRGQSAAPLADMNVDQAYTCFVAAPMVAATATEETSNGGVSGDGGFVGSGGSASTASRKLSTEQRVVELDGSRARPVDHGVCTDLLEDVARIVREEFVVNSDSLKFNLMYLGQPDVAR